MEQVPFIEIKPEEVSTVHADEFDVLNEQFERDLNKLKDDKAALTAKMEKDRDEREQQFQEMNANHEVALKAAKDAARRRNPFTAFLGGMAGFLLGGPIGAVAGFTGGVACS